LTSPIGGFWRRFAAFGVDSLILATIGQVIGFVCFDNLVRLGAAGRLVGFPIALAYFGILNSRIGGGQTLGKRLLKLRVVDREGTLIGLGRSALRYTILALPIFLDWSLWPISINPDGPTSFPSVALYIVLALIVYGMGLSDLYLFIFNFRTRQTLHDLVAGTFVVRADAPVARIELTMWRPHLAIVATMAAIGVAGSVTKIYLDQSGSGSARSPLRAIEQNIASRPSVRSAAVEAVTHTVGASFPGEGAAQAAVTHLLDVSVVLGDCPDDPEKAADTFADIALEISPDLVGNDEMAVRLRCEFDIGIATWRHKYLASHSREEWRQRLVR
jgi:uncharacterized RDD family membrane protein YckC